MKKALINLFFILFAPQICIADEDHYISAQIGSSMPSSKLRFSWVDDQHRQIKIRPKSAINYDILLGKRIYNNLFAEIEYAYSQRHGIQANGNYFGTFPASVTSKIQNHSLFANLSYHFKELNAPFTPYVTLGAGASLNKANKLTLTIPAIDTDLHVNGKTQANFAWQVGTGVLIPIKNSLELNISYKFRRVGKINVQNIEGTSLKGNLYNSNILIGLTYKF